MDRGAWQVTVHGVTKSCVQLSTHACATVYMEIWWCFLRVELSSFILLYWLDGRESQWTPGAGDGQGGLACCNSWGHKESDTTERLIWSDLILLYWSKVAFFFFFWTAVFHLPNTSNSDVAQFWAEWFMWCDKHQGTNCYEKEENVAFLFQGDTPRYCLLYIKVLKG